jgi:hypothetical protein
MRKAKPKNYAAPPERLVMRLLSVDASAADMATKTVPVIIATETPVEMQDERTGLIYHEILDMDGGRVRGERDRLPIVDSHDRNTVRNVLGTIRNVRKEPHPEYGMVMRGDASFARDDDSQDAFEKLLDGHLEDFSITAIRNQQKRVAPNETYIHRSKPIVGPAVIVTDWTATDASLVAAGADENSRVVLRSMNQFKEINRMLTDEMKTMLVGLGLPEQITDAEQAITYMAGLLKSKQTEPGPAPEVVADRMEVVEEVEEVEDVEKMDKTEEVERKIQRAVQVERTRRREIEALCKKANVERALRDQLLDGDCTLEVAREQVLKTMIERQQFGGAGGNTGSDVRVEAGANSVDKTRDAIRDGLVMRAARGGNLKLPADFRPSQGADDFANMSLLRIAERHLREQGYNVDKMNGPDIARAAMGNRTVLERHRPGIIRDAYHTTGSFPALMLDASNKTLLAGYSEYQATWKAWARQGASTADLKPINRIRYSESGNPEMVPERAPYPERQMSDERETYTPQKNGNVFTVSWETIVNDDLDAISRTPQMHGNACARLVNRSVYQVLIQNATMGDGQALFSTSHASGANFVAQGSGGAPGVTTLDKAFELMMLQKGLNSDAILGLVPRFLIVPPQLSGKALELVNSLSYNAANNNEGVRNIYGAGGPRTVEVVIEPQLALGVTTQWFMSADPSTVDTVEVTFLQGEETPQLDQEWDFDRDVYKYKVRQTFGVKAIDWRGLFSNYGA